MVSKIGANRADILSGQAAFLCAALLAVQPGLGIVGEKERLEFPLDVVFGIENAVVYFIIDMRQHPLGVANRGAKGNTVFVGI